MEWCGIIITINRTNASIMVTEGTSFCWQQGPVQKRLFPDKTRGRKIGQYRFTSQETVVLLWDSLLLITGQEREPLTRTSSLVNTLFLSVSHYITQYSRPDYFFFFLLPPCFFSVSASPTWHSAEITAKLLIATSQASSLLCFSVLCFIIPPESTWSLNVSFPQAALLPPRMIPSHLCAEQTLLLLSPVDSVVELTWCPAIKEKEQVCCYLF